MLRPQSRVRGGETRCSLRRRLEAAPRGGETARTGDRAQGSESSCGQTRTAAADSGDAHGARALRRGRRTPRVSFPSGRRRQGGVATHRLTRAGSGALSGSEGRTRLARRGGGTGGGKGARARGVAEEYRRAAARGPGTARPGRPGLSQGGWKRLAGPARRRRVGGDDCRSQGESWEGLAGRTQPRAHTTPEGEKGRKGEEGRESGAAGAGSRRRAGSLRAAGQGEG
ncbi:circumsporozoite protein-like [Ananas comosus]|uniref:Circumsporozoite protein-like n=1 Tax=Ananas comosus TaxID=4615 RepID=A0A6P5G934_ANACO|nr:circumsporozoite protein-like [Ananas comosus]